MIAQPLVNSPVRGWAGCMSFAVGGLELGVRRSWPSAGAVSAEAAGISERRTRTRLSGGAGTGGGDLRGGPIKPYHCASPCENPPLHVSARRGLQRTDGSKLGLLKRVLRNPLSLPLNESVELHRAGQTHEACCMLDSNGSKCERLVSGILVTRHRTLCINFYRSLSQFF